MIAKVASTDDGSYRRRFVPFPSARAALRAILERTCVEPPRTVLLPSFVGWSPREGSGIHDPINELGVDVAFYRMTASLHVDVDDVKRQLAQHGSCLILLVHYYGWVDPSYREIVSLAREHDAILIEDGAHAMLGDVVRGSCGRLGEAQLVSLHKLLPLATGGGMLVNPSARPEIHTITGIDGPSPFEFDLHTLAEARRERAQLLARLIEPLADRVVPLRVLTNDVVPQTYPVRIVSTSRDKLYELMNAEGFGVVSLYHTLVGGISVDAFPASHALAREIMNLPVHQEASPDNLVAMVVALDRLTR